MGDVDLATSNEFRQLAAAYLGITEIIGKGRGGGVSGGIKRRLSEILGLFPEVDSYLKALPGRAEDFRS